MLSGGVCRFLECAAPHDLSEPACALDGMGFAVAAVWCGPAGDFCSVFRAHVLIIGHFAGKVKRRFTILLGQ